MIFVFTGSLYIAKRSASRAVADEEPPLVAAQRESERAPVAYRGLSGAHGEAQAVYHRDAPDGDCDRVEQPPAGLRGGL